MHLDWKDMKERVRRTLALVLTLLLVFSTVFLPGAGAAVTKSQINDLKSKATSLASEKAKLQTQLDKLSKSKNAAVDQKRVLEQKINVLQEEIAVSEQSIAKLAEMISQKEQELADAQAEEARYYDLFIDRVRNMEENGEVSYWSVIFNARDFSDLLDRVSMIQEIMDYDNEVMDQLAQARQAVADAKADLEENKSEQERVRANLASQQSDLQSEKKKVDTVLAQINNDYNSYAHQLEVTEEDAQATARQLKQAEATYAAQIEAQRRADAEAARLRAQQQAAANASRPNNSGNSTANNSGSSSEGGGTDYSGGYIWPVPGYTRITSPFGYRNCPYHGRELHGGCDIPAAYGTPIKAAKSGVVVISTYGSSYGNYVAIAHGDGSRTMYAHMSSRAASVGSTVSQGQVIGYVGSTGNSTGNHLHLELWTSSSSSSRVNPLNYIPRS